MNLIECGGYIDCANSLYMDYPECEGITIPEVPLIDTCEATNYTDPGCSCINDPEGYDCVCFLDPYGEHFDMSMSPPMHSYCHMHMCYWDDTQEGCAYHACIVNPTGVDADGFYCPANPCFHDDTIEGCPNWACNIDWFGEDPHSYNGFCPGNECYMDTTMPNCPDFVDPCVLYPRI